MGRDLGLCGKWVFNSRVHTAVRQPSGGPRGAPGVNLGVFVEDADGKDPLTEVNDSPQTLWRHVPGRPVTPVTCAFLTPRVSWHLKTGRPPSALGSRWARSKDRPRRLLAWPRSLVRVPGWAYWARQVCAHPCDVYRITALPGAGGLQRCSCGPPPQVAAPVGEPAHAVQGDAPNVHL